MDYVAEERAHQQAVLRTGLLDHVRRTPEALIVVEEYDKLDCAMRGFFRQLLENGAVGNATLNRAVVVLESNLGYLQLHALLKSVGREGVTPEQAQLALKDLIFERWERQACEDRTDTIKMASRRRGGGGEGEWGTAFFPMNAHMCMPTGACTDAEEGFSRCWSWFWGRGGTLEAGSRRRSRCPGHACTAALTTRLSCCSTLHPRNPSRSPQVGLIDIFLPFFPLERQHIRELFDLRLRGRSEALVQAGLGRLAWDKGLIDHLTGLVEFDGAYPIEGAKEVGITLTKTVSRPVRLWAQRHPARPGRPEAELPLCTLRVHAQPGAAPAVVCA